MDNEKQRGNRFMLLLHFYKESKFIGQKLLWVEFTRNSGHLINLLLNHLTAGTKELKGSEGLVTSDPDFESMRIAVADVRSNLSVYGDSDLPENFNEATEIKVMQITTGWPVHEASYGMLGGHS